MNKSHFIKLVAAGLIALTLEKPTQSMAETSSAPQKVVTIEGITQYDFPNGLKLLLVPDQSRPTVTVNLTVLVGSRHEGYGEAGMAHLLEHMVFKGTPQHPKIPQALQARGAKFNGTTWLDRTNYFETLPASDDNLEFAIRLEADRMINSHIKGEDLASEMTVVRSEFERGENSPARVLGQRMMAVAYEWHNYGQSTIGNRSDIERVPVEKLRDFYKRFYQPDNAVLVVAGRFDETKTLGFVEKYFGSLPRPARQLDTTYTEEPAQDGERLVTLRRVGEVPLVGVIYHVASGPHPDFAALDVLENILTRAPSGRLYKALVETRKASSVSGAVYALHDPGVLRIMAEVSKGNSPEVVLDTLLDTAEKVGEEGVTDAEVERAKAQLLKQRELAAADTSGIAVQLSEWAAQGDWRLYFLYRDRIESVTADEVRKVAATYLRRNNRTVGLYIPTETSERVAVPAAPELAGMVKDYKGREDVILGEAFDASPTNIESRTERLTLPTGTKVALLPKKTHGGTVDLRIALRYGNAKSLAGRLTAAELLPELMLRGTKQLSRQELQDALDKNRVRLRAEVESAAGLAVFSLHTKRPNLPAALGLLRQVLREPALPDQELEVLRREQLSGLEQELTEPRALARRRLSRQLNPYPETDVRYVTTIDEDIRRLQATKLAEIKAVYAELLGPEAAQVTIIGDFDRDETVKALTGILTDWKSSETYARIDRPMRDWQGGKQTILTPDKANAVYYSGLVLPLRDDDPDYPALVIGDYILGAGALSSRLGNRIRQREGLSYEVRSTFAADAFDKRASLAIVAICNPKNIGKVESAVREELRSLIEKGPTAEELERAKQGYLQRQEVTLTEDDSLAYILNWTLHTGRTMDYYRDLDEKIKALTPEQVAAALRKHLERLEPVIVEAGDFAPQSAAAK